MRGANSEVQSVYPGKYAVQNPDRPAFIMAASGQAVTYRDYEARCNRLAHFLKAQGLDRADHFAVFMENNDRYLECCGAGTRTRKYFSAK